MPRLNTHRKIRLPARPCLLSIATTEITASLSSAVDFLNSVVSDSLNIFSDFPPEGSLLGHSFVLFGFAFSKRNRLDFMGGKTKNTFALFGANTLGDNKQLPKLADQSFSKQWINKK